MIIETESLLTISKYAKKHGITSAGVEKRVKKGKIKQLLISGVKFIDEGCTDYLEEYDWFYIIKECNDYAKFYYKLIHTISYTVFEELLRSFRQETGYDKKYLYALCNYKIFDQQHVICIKQLPIIFYIVNSIPDNTTILTSHPFSIKKENTILIEGEQSFF